MRRGIKGECGNGRREDTFTTIPRTGWEKKEKANCKRHVLNAKRRGKAYTKKGGKHRSLGGGRLKLQGRAPCCKMKELGKMREEGKSRPSKKYGENNWGGVVRLDNWRNWEPPQNNPLS